MRVNYSSVLVYRMVRKVILYKIFKCSYIICNFCFRYILDACLGDSGGPVLYWTGRYWEQVGVVSYTYHCGRAGYPGIYTRISPYWEWMENVLNQKREYIEPQDPSPFPTTTTTRFTKTPRPTTKRTTTTTTTIEFTGSSTDDVATLETTTVKSTNTSRISTTWTSSSASTRRTTTEPIVKKTYTCPGDIDNCGCSMTNVIATQKSQNSSSKVRIGEDAHPYSWSMIVSLQINGKNHDCTGTILSDSFILTSAQCALKITNDTNTAVVAGIHHLYQQPISNHIVDQIHIHEDYTIQNPYVHDIAILHLDKPLALKTEPIFSTICLSENKTSHSEETSELIVVGWKHSNSPHQTSDVTQQVLIQSIIDRNRLCFDSYYYNDIYQFCAGIKQNYTGKLKKKLYIHNCYSCVFSSSRYVYR